MPRCSEPHIRFGATVPLHSEVAQTRVVVWTTAQRPVKFSLFAGNRHVIGAGETTPHQAMIIELPVLIAVAAKLAAESSGHS